MKKNKTRDEKLSAISLEMRTLDEQKNKLKKELSDIYDKQTKLIIDFKREVMVNKDSIS